MLVFDSKNSNETQMIGERLGKILGTGVLLYLNGDIGTGKTVFTRGIANALRINDYITSPTFTIVNEYDGVIPLYHFDVYRINDIDEMHEIGFYEYLDSNGILVIEWANRIKEILPEEAIYINIINKGDNTRLIEITCIGEKNSYIEEGLMSV